MPDCVLFEHTPTPPPTDEKWERAQRLRRLLTWLALVLALGGGLWIYAANMPDGPSGAARIKANCQFQYPGDAAGVAACVKAKGG